MLTELQAGGLMFTGIVTALGTVREIAPIGAGQDMRLVIEAAPEFLAGSAPVALGASIACSGCCLTAVALGPDWFAVDASAETLSKTTLGAWRVGHAAQSRTPAAHGRRARRAYRLRPCRRRSASS